MKPETRLRLIRGGGLFLGQIMAIGVFCIGLLAPLTPSEGYPSVRDLLIFAGLPSAIFLSCTWLAKSLWLRVALGIQMLAVLAITTFLIASKAGLV